MNFKPDTCGGFEVFPALYEDCASRNDDDGCNDAHNQCRAQFHRFSHSQISLIIPTETYL